MKFIVGLGNPGEKFKNTRHNTGWLVLDEIAKKQKAGNWKFQKKFQAEILEINVNAGLLLLVKPQTFMNDSGVVVRKILNQVQDDRKYEYNNLYIVHDELDFLLGEYKIQFGRSAAGHKGVESVIKELGTKDFWRVRIGIGPNTKPSEEFVLEKFRKEEKGILDRVMEKAVKDLAFKISSSK